MGGSLRAGIVELMLFWWRVYMIQELAEEVWGCSGSWCCGR